MPNLGYLSDFLMCLVVIVSTCCYCVLHLFVITAAQKYKVDGFGSFKKIEGAS